jgi:hypothetical protein
MATTTVFSIGPDGKMNKYTFLETTKINEPKLYMECHWMVPCKVGISLCGYDYPMTIHVQLGLRFFSNKRVLFIFP